jgi:hypothetical protein
MSEEEHRASQAAAPHPAEIPPGRLWTGVLLAPAAWIAHGALGWYFGYEACGGLTASGARAVLGILFVIAIVLALAGGWIAWGNWGHTTSERHVGHIKGRDRLEYMSAGGVLVSGIFTIAIIWNGLIPLFIFHCGGMR